MSDLEKKLKKWVDVLADSTEVLTGAEVRSLTNGRLRMSEDPRKPRSWSQLVLAVGALIIVTLATGLVLVSRGTNTDPVASLTDNEIAALRAIPDNINVEFYDFYQVSNASFVDQAVEPTLEQLIANTLNSTGNPAPTAEAWESELGVNLSQVRSVARWGIPPDVVTVLDGEFKTLEIESAVMNDTNWADILNIKDYRGITYYSWGSDRQIISQRSSVLGSFARRVALVDDLLIITRSTDTLHETIDRVLDRDAEWLVESDLKLGLGSLWKSGYWSAMVGIAPEASTEGRFTVTAMAPAVLGDTTIEKLEINIVGTSVASSSELADKFHQAAEKITNSLVESSRGTTPAIETSRQERVIQVRVDLAQLRDQIDLATLLVDLMAPLN